MHNSDRATPVPENSSEHNESSCQDPKTICDVLANTLDSGSHLLDFSHTATPRHIRLVDCRALTEEDMLRIVEFPEFPTLSYAAISYPWRGVALDEHFSGHTFAVKGAEHADPVGTDALKHACAAALLRRCPFLWLDRLCIMQDNKEDKHWQIQHMYRVYKSCSLCLVLAGGVQRLARLDEPTTWIHRSWTLQEVLAPPEVAVLLNWGLGSGTALSGGTRAMFDEVVAGESALAPLSLILQACTVGTLSFTSTEAEATPAPTTAMVEAAVFSAHPAKHTYNDIPFWRPQRKILAPNVIALTIAMDPVLASDPEVRAHAVWQSALMRTSSRPVDMVFSIMGLFDVSLDPSRFHPQDRRGATIALAQAILDAGGSASWLGVGCRLSPDPSLSTFPIFPRTSVSGVALVQTVNGVQEVSELVDPAYPTGEALVPLPKGSMDVEGYFSCTARAIRLVPVENPSHDAGKNSVFEAFDGSRWSARNHEEDEDDGRDVYAVLLSWFNKYYPGQTSALDTDNIRAILVEKHSEPNSFHVRSFFTLHRKHRASVLSWPERAFRLGGPEPPPSSDLLPTDDEEVEQPYFLEQARWPRVPGRGPLVSIEDEAIRKARWAVPQRVLERSRKSGG